MTLPVVVSAWPLIATWPPVVMVHLLPLASVIAAVVPVTIVLFAEGIIGTGNGLVAVPAVGAQDAFGWVSPHQSLLLFSCQILPFTYASSMTPPVVVSALPLIATWPPVVMVHLLPLASVIAAVVPVTTVLFADGMK